MEKTQDANKYPRPYLSKGVITRDSFGYPELTRFYAGEAQTGYVLFEWLQTNSSSGINFLKPVISKDVLTPPASPVVGDRYWIGGVGTGDWDSKDYQIAEWDGTEWVYTLAASGNLAKVTDIGLLFVDDGSSLNAFKEGVVLEWSVQNIDIVH